MDDKLTAKITKYAFLNIYRLLGIYGNYVLSYFSTLVTSYVLTDNAIV